MESKLISDSAGRASDRNMPYTEQFGKFPILYAGSDVREGSDVVEPHARRVDEELDTSELLDRCGDELAAVVDEDGPIEL